MAKVFTKEEISSIEITRIFEYWGWKNQDLLYLDTESFTAWSFEAAIGDFYFTGNVIPDISNLTGRIIIGEEYEVSEEILTVVEKKLDLLVKVVAREIKEILKSQGIEIQKIYSLDELPEGVKVFCSEFGPLTARTYRPEDHYYRFLLDVYGYGVLRTLYVNKKVRKEFLLQKKLQENPDFRELYFL
jgi:hypothetical protein